ncbi:hypothetical protein D778_02074 [Xanthomarina gelatinilytica]|uniref:Uncharacterized protein n=1 Tax=Xanthomarina gelatinilytica TaxID=1137281 RepID=M7N368_9FLAO|nr:hypothetical protein D778_02074 [Xanthomarina gelatinilytica]
MFPVHNSYLTAARYIFQHFKILFLKADINNFITFYVKKLFPEKSISTFS